MKPSSRHITVDPVNNFLPQFRGSLSLQSPHSTPLSCCLKWKSRTLQRQPADKPWMMMDSLVDSSVLHTRRYLNVLQCELSSFSFCHSFPLVCFSFLLSFSPSFFAFLSPFPFSFFLILPFSFASLPLASFLSLQFSFCASLSLVLSSFFCFLFFLLLLLFLFQHIIIFIFS